MSLRVPNRHARLFETLRDGNAAATPPLPKLEGRKLPPVTPAQMTMLRDQARASLIRRR